MNAEKRLRFSEPLPTMVLSGEKNVTWRINDEKDIRVGDTLSLCKIDGKEFAKANVIDVKIIPFGKLSMDGHERFSSNGEMYATYSKYYNMNVVPETPTKVIRFELVK